MLPIVVDPPLSGTINSCAKPSPRLSARRRCAPLKSVDCAQHDLPLALSYRPIILPYFIIIICTLPHAQNSDFPGMFPEFLHIPK